MLTFSLNNRFLSAYLLMVLLSFLFPGNAGPLAREEAIDLNDLLCSTLLCLGNEQT